MSRLCALIALTFGQWLDVTLRDSREKSPRVIETSSGNPPSRLRAVDVVVPPVVVPLQLTLYASRLCLAVALLLIARGIREDKRRSQNAPHSPAGEVKSSAISPQQLPSRRRATCTSTFVHKKKHVHAHPTKLRAPGERRTRTNQLATPRRVCAARFRCTEVDPATSLRSRRSHREQRFRSDASPASRSGGAACLRPTSPACSPASGSATPSLRSTSRAHTERASKNVCSTTRSQ